MLTTHAEHPTFKRAIVPQPYVQKIDLSTNGATTEASAAASNKATPSINCAACRKYHAVGSCPIKIAGVEYCNLCGMAHYGHARVCPHIQSETQVRAMLEALKSSNEPEHLINEAKRYLRGLKGNLVQLKKQREAKEIAAREAAYQQSLRPQNDPWMGI